MTVRKLAGEVFSVVTKLATEDPIRRTWKTEALSFTVSVYADARTTEAGRMESSGKART